MEHLFNQMARFARGFSQSVRGGSKPWVAIVGVSHDPRDWSILTSFMARLQAFLGYSATFISHEVLLDHEASVQQARKILNKGFDLVFVSGDRSTTAMRVAMREFDRSTFKTAVIFCSAHDVGRSNLEGGDWGEVVYKETNTREVVDHLETLMPTLRDATVLTDTSSLYSGRRSADLQTELGTRGIQARDVTIKPGESVLEALEGLGGDVGGAIVSNIGHHIGEQCDKLIAFAEIKKVPLFVNSRKTVEQGAAAGVCINEEQVGMKAAALAIEARNGKKLQSTPATVVRCPSALLINREAARRRGVTLWEGLDRYMID